jgi:hypothetical protein
MIVLMTASFLGGAIHSAPIQAGSTNLFQSRAQHVRNFNIEATRRLH